MENFTFELTTRYVFGVGVIDGLGAECVTRDFKRVLLHYGCGSIKRNGVYDTVTASLRKAGVEYFDAGGVTPNPQAQTCERSAKIFQDNNCDAIIGVGGGSVMDSAKYTATCVAALRKGDVDAWSIMDLKEGPAVYAALAPLAPPVLSVLTMSATGSECNPGMVITDVKTHCKYNACMKSPLVAYVDPSVQCSLPAWQTASGAVDIMSHCIESLTRLVVTDRPVPETAFRLAAADTEAVIATMPRLLADLKDVDARADLCWAATVGLNLIIQSPFAGGDFGCHFCAHAISSAFNEMDSSKSVSHGASLGVVHVGYFRWLARQSADGRFPKAGMEALKRILMLAGGSTDVEVAMKNWRERLVAWGMPTTIDELCEPFPAYKQKGGAEHWLPEFTRLVRHRGTTGGLFPLLEESEITEIFELSNI